MIEVGLTKSKYNFSSVSPEGIEMPVYWSPCICDESNVGAFRHQPIAPLLLLSLTTDRAASPNKDNGYHNKDNGYHNNMMLTVIATVMLMIFSHRKI